ncbi:MAG: 4-(cytidine 5'-diphospho)-2-C-methyl-D-erythritol kinase [Candidatus Diapherotrites archaeon]
MDVNSPAKINLFLDLTAKREDGFHEIKTCMQALSLQDVLSFSVTKFKGIYLDCNDPKVPLDGRNLVYKAAAILQDRFKIEQGIACNIHKSIPSAGGLAGGSSNGAATLNALNKLWALQLSSKQLELIAGEFGSDTVFFVKGGTQLATGRGEILSPLPTPPKLDIVIVSPELPVPSNKTASLYSYVHVKELEHPSWEAFEKALKKGNAKKLVENCVNVFEQVKYPLYEKLWPKIEEAGKKKGVLKTLLCGSGPSYALFCKDSKTAENLAKEFPQAWACTI